MSAHHLQNQFVVRNFKVATDVLPLIQLRRQLGETIDEETLRAEFVWQNQDPEQDRWVVEATDNPGVLLGHGFGFHTIPERYLFWLIVHPDWRRQGFGHALLAQVIQRAHELGAEHLSVNPDVEEMAAHEFLRRNGFRAVSNCWFMEAPADIPVPGPVWPKGYTVRSYAQIKNPALLQEVSFRSYHDQWGHGENRKSAAEVTPKAWAADWLSPADPNGEGIFLAFAPNGDVAGIGRGQLNLKEGQRDQPTGLVDAPGVVPEHRVHALQRPLVLTVMDWLRTRGQGKLELYSFGDNEKTVNLYRELGFVLTKQLIAYQFDLL